MGCSDIIREMPVDIGCISTYTQSAVIPRKESAYLGRNHSYQKFKPTLVLKFMSTKENEVARWWKQVLNYGVNPFTVYVNYFGGVHKLLVQFTDNIGEELNIFHTNTFKLEILNIDEVMVRPYYLYSLQCDLTAKCGDIMICS